MSGFSCYHTKLGDLMVCGGVVVEKRTGARFLVGSGGVFTATAADNAGDHFTAVQSASGASFVGGSGRNVIAAGLEPLTSGAACPTGFFMPTIPGSYRAGIFTLEVTGPDDATISDGTDIVAVLTTGGTAPVGDYDSTVYGTATYGPLILLVHQPFTLTVAAEDPLGGDIPQCLVSVSAGTALAGVFAPLSEDVYESVDDPDWTIYLYPDGSAELAYLGDVMATRASGQASDPAGAYLATVLGMATFNLTDDEPADGEAWTATVKVIGRVPRVGVVYLTLVEVAGVLTSVTGPDFATVLPTSGGGTFYFPLTICDGYDLEEIHSGALVWDSQGAVTDPVKVPSFLTADLPASADWVGSTAFVTDSTDDLATGLGAVLVGGGGNFVPVYSDGTDWRVG